MSILLRVLVLLALARPAIGGDSGESHLMGVMGDSISAATFARSSTRDRPDLEEAIGVRVWLPALGNTDNKNTLSWASGLEINSHFVRLKRLFPKLSVRNVSVPGEKAKGMEAQARELAAALESGDYVSLKYLTVMIGANDVCSEDAAGKPNPEFSEEMKRAFRILAQIRQKEPLRILVSAIPRIPDLGSEEISRTRTVGNVTCDFMRNQVLGFCPTLPRWTTEEEYDIKMSTVEDRNQLLRQLTVELNSEFPQLQIIFSEGFHNGRIVPEYLAGDCFHPNKLGQEEISTSLWREQPWF
jgi:hypothetical protein